MGAFLMGNPKCVFIHIPKTAGSTIRNGIFKGEYTGPVFEVLPEDWNEYFKFAFVRNPYDRMVSAWKMFSTGMGNSKWAYKDKPPLEGVSFYDFLKIATDQSIDHHKRDTMNSVLRHHTLPQVHPYHCFEYADFIGKFENLENDFKVISEKIGLKNYNINHLNKTKRDTYKSYYDDKTFELVSKEYDEDIKRFDYTF